MSGVAHFLRASWAKEPVVCFSIALGAFGLSLPLFVPKLWGKYPDKIQVDEQDVATEQVRRAALKRSGAFPITRGDNSIFWRRAREDVIKLVVLTASVSFNIFYALIVCVALHLFQLRWGKLACLICALSGGCECRNLLVCGFFPGRLQRSINSSSLKREK